MSIKVFDEPDVAAGRHRAGLRRLFSLQIRDALKYLDKNIPELQKMGTAFMPLGTVDELRAQIIDVALDRAFLMEPLPAHAASFKSRGDEGRGRLTLIANEVARLAATILVGIAQGCALRRVVPLPTLPVASNHRPPPTTANAVVRAGERPVARRCRGWGRILTIGSINQTHPAPDLAIYAALKSAQHNLAINLARQLAPHGVTINNLSPGLVATARNAWRRVDANAWATFQAEANPMGRAGTPNEMASAALLLCSDAGSFITGADLQANGGAHL